MGRSQAGQAKSAPGQAQDRPKTGSARGLVEFNEEQKSGAGVRGEGQESDFVQNFAVFWGFRAGGRRCDCSQEHLRLPICISELVNPQTRAGLCFPHSRITAFQKSSTPLPWIAVRPMCIKNENVFAMLFGLGQRKIPRSTSIPTSQKIME